jgi:rhodanese-related sulfurtransferase
MTSTVDRIRSDPKAARRPPGFLLCPFGWAAEPLPAMAQAEPRFLAHLFEAGRPRMHLFALALAHLDRQPLSPSIAVSLIGWPLLVYIPRDRGLINQHASEHTLGIAGGIPLLALDMYEHAYHIDFGANARAYINAFIKNIDWKAAEGRHEDAAKVEPPRPLVQEEFGDLPGVSVEEVKAMIEAGKPVQIVDARPRHTMSRQQDIMDGATWRDPDLVQEWSSELSKSDPVVVFCVYGFHVGCKTAIILQEAGYDAKYMKGGHSAWKAIGGAIKSIAEESPETDV